MIRFVTNLIQMWTKCGFVSIVFLLYTSLLSCRIYMWILFNTGVIMCLRDMPNGNLGDMPLSTTAAAVYRDNECLIILNGTQTFHESVISCEAFEAEVANIATSTMQIVGSFLEVGNDCVDVWSSLVNSVTTAISGSQLVNNDSTCNATRLCQTIMQEGFISTMNHTVQDLTVPCSNRYRTICLKSRKNSTMINFTSQTGNFAQLCSDGKNYTNDVMLVQNFVATSGHRIIFKLHSFDIEFQERCLYDYMRTSGMVKNHRFCGKSVRPVSFISERETATLEFNTDSDVTACGFNVSWHWIKTGEAFHIRFIELDKHGFITSVNYPDEFPDRIDACTSIEIPKDNRMLLEIHNLTLPGENCDETRFTISSESENIHSFCGGYSMTPKPLLSNQLALIESGTALFCLNANGLNAMDGVNIEFKIVPTVNTTISTTLTLTQDEVYPIFSLMFPQLIPSLLMQEMTFRTQIGYKIHVELNITVLRTDNCSEDNINIIDNSLQPEGEVKVSFSCRNLTNETVEGIENVRFSSVLNSVKIQGLTGSHKSGTSSVSFAGIARSIKDPDYLDITKRVQGSFDECFNTTCQNGGVCSDVVGNRFTCECPPRYTGLFCQVNKCELNPCEHGSCNLTHAGFQCTCDPNYWGELCDMNNAVCQITKCSGNGECVAFNNRDFRCLCNQQYTGSKCNIPLPEKDPEENMTIGQKLLKEPIWIGMIVIVNLVVFFCISYVIRRKCGRKISKLFPKRNKASVNTSKENSKGEPSTFSNGNSDHLSGRNIYSITLETPKASGGSLWSTRGNVYRENLDSISAPSTPVVTEQNQDAAMKLFASYNSRRDQLTPTITSLPTNTSPDFSRTARNIMSCGIKGGTLALNRDDDFEHHMNDATHGILRSYTVSTEIRDFESRRTKLRKEIPHKASSYSGSPFRSGSTAYFEQHRPNGTNANIEPVKQRHCYPEIRIINENNIEEIKKSDSENSDIDVNLDEIDMNNIHVADKEVKPVENTDSGYPSTTMSNTTHSESILTESGEIKVGPTASEKRKMFGSKSKSASFYKLGAVEVSGNILQREHRNPIEITSAKSYNLSTDKCRSFESDRCSSCHRETIDRCAYSYEKDVEKFHKHRVRQLSHDPSRYCSRHKRHKRKRYSDCRQHSQSKDSYYPRPLLLPKSNSHNDTCMHFNSRHRRITDAQRYGRGSRVLNSSTESDSCLCSNYDSRYHPRKNNRNAFIIKEAFSESDCHQRQSYDRRQGNKCEPHFCQDVKPEDTYKSNLMKSFLSDTYHAKYKGYSGYSFISEETPPGPAIFPSNPSSSSSMDVIPSKHAQLHINLSRRSDTVLERSDESVLRLDVSPSLPNSDVSNVSLTCSDSYAMREPQDIDIDIDDLDRSTQSAIHYSPQRNHSLYTENYAGVGNKSGFINADADESSQCFTEEIVSKQSSALTKLKDSAYQTKQSSLDKFRGDRSFSTSGSVKTRTKSIEKISNEDTVRRHLHQAALKLALLKRLQNGREVSKDSAVNTFSEEDISADEKEPRGTFRPLVKKTSGSLAFQLGQMSLSEVKEEHSGGLSKDTESYNTPNNEPVIDNALERVVDDTSVVSMKEMHDISKPKRVIDSIHMDETKV